MFDDIFDKYKKKKEPDIFDKYKPQAIEPAITVPTETQLGIGAKEDEIIYKPLTLQMLYSINLNYNPPSSKPIEKIKRYDIDIKKLEKEAEISGGLKPELYSAYEQIIEKYNEAIEEHNIQVGTKYKKAFKKYKQLTGLPEEAGISAPLSRPTLTTKPLSQIGFKGRMRGIGEAPEKYTLEGVTADYLKVNKNAWITWFNELKVAPDKWKFLKGETWSPELKAISEEAKFLSEKASELGVNPDDWVQTGIYAGFFATLAISIYPVISKLPANILNKIAFKVEGKTVKGKELLSALRKVRYPEAPDIGKPSVFDKKVFAKFVEGSGIETLSKRISKGIEITEVTPRFAFGAKLYGGIPADEIVRSLVETGKITADIARELSLAKPELISQVIQNLSIVSPAIASKLAPELVKLIPEEKAIEKPEEIPTKEPWEPLTLPPPAEVPKIEPEFKEPNVHKYYMPKDQLMREIGAEPLTRPIMLKKEALMLKIPEVKKWVKDVFKEMKAKAPFAEKLKAGIFNKPTEEVARFRDLLNTYEYSPDFMEPETKAKFDQLRSFTKGMLHDTNEMRVRAGLKPIPDWGAYVPHFLDELARKVHYDEQTRTKVEGIVGKKLYRGPKGGNPTAIQRKIGVELDHIFSKDLEKLLTSMAMFDLRDIYLAEPYAIYRAQMDELIKEGSMPQEVRTEVENFIAYDIFDKRTDLDNAINATLKPGTDIANLFLKPFNRVITDPVRIISSIYRFAVFGGAIAGKVPMLGRNFLQFALNLSIYGPVATIKGQFLAPKDVVEKIRNLDVYKLSVRKFEDVPATIPWGLKTIAKVIQAGLAPYAKTHAGLTYISNVDRSARVGYFWSLGKQKWQKSKGAMEYTKAYAKKMGIKEGSQRYKNLFHREGDELGESEEAIGSTQWFYFQTRMPRPYRGQAAKAFWSLNSWWMNFFGKHWREMMSRCRGVTGRGRILTRWERLNAFKGLAIILGVGEAVRRKYKLRIAEFLAFPFPKYIQTHLFQIMINTYGALTAKTQKERDTYQLRVKYNLKMLVPYSGAYKEYVKFINGEITLKEYLFYVEKVAKGEISPPSDIFDKYGPTKTTEEDTFDKYGKETAEEDIFNKYKR